MASLMSFTVNSCLFLGFSRPMRKFSQKQRGKHLSTVGKFNKASNTDYKSNKMKWLNQKDKRRSTTPQTMHI